jgi:hypothetical protein
MTEPKPDVGKETITLHELLERSARAALDLQREDGSFPPGQNGVYEESETPVRTTSHWLTTLSKVYEITGDEEFADAANAAAEYLLSDEARPQGFTFHSRNTKRKDNCDGLIGQAMPIRGLARAGVALNRPELLEVAKDVFSLHPFDEDLGLWRRVEIDGSDLSFDRTLNHQLLFAGAAAHLSSEFPSVEGTLQRFVERLAANVAMRPDGTLRHYVRPPLSQTAQTVIWSPRDWRLLLNNALSYLYTVSSARKRKERGYHSVNLLGLAQIQTNSCSVDILVDGGGKFLETVTAPDAVEAAAENQYYGGMTPGIDVALALWEFRSADSSRVREWVERDIRKKYDANTELLSKKTKDPVFQASSISYAVDLPNIEITV